MGYLRIAIKYRGNGVWTEALLLPDHDSYKGMDIDGIASSALGEWDECVLMPLTGKQCELVHCVRGDGNSTVLTLQKQSYPDTGAMKNAFAKLVGQFAFVLKSD